MQDGGGRPRRQHRCPRHAPQHRQGRGLSLDGDLARSFATDVWERHARHLVDLLIHALEKPSAPVSALDLSCGTGFAALEVAKVLPRGSRIIAISDDRKAVVQFHRTLPPELRAYVFVRKEKPHRLPFALSTFDLVWACLPGRALEPLPSIVRGALRVLRPGGMLAFCMPLRGSFHALASAADGLAAGHPELSLQRVIADRPQLLDLEEAQELFRKAGAIEIGAKRATFDIVAQPPLSRDRLLAMHLLPLWLGRTPGDVGPLLDQLIDEPLPVKVHVGCIVARRGHDELEVSAAAAEQR